MSFNRLTCDWLELHVTLFVWGWGGGGWWWRGRFGKDPVGGCDAWAAKTGGTRAAGAVWSVALSDHRSRPDGSDRWRPQRCAWSAGRQSGFESGHGLGGGAAAGTSLGCIWIPDHHGVERAAGRILGPTAVFEGLQRVQNNIGRVLGYILPLQLTQLMESCVHGFLYILTNMSRREIMSVWSVCTHSPSCVCGISILLDLIYLSILFHFSLSLRCYFLSWF